MIQDIAPHKFNNAFADQAPCDEDYLLIFNEQNILLKKEAEGLVIPKVKDLRQKVEQVEGEMIRLFGIDGQGVYLFLTSEKLVIEEYELHKTQVFRELQPSWMGFVGVTGYQLYKWYIEHKYCGKCGNQNHRSKTERALVCNECGLTIYPKICPAVIVGILDGDRILLTRYAGRAYTNYALVAGFMEIGETFEETVAREVMEEVGLKVKNIRYYKNQPWGFSDSILMGFYADVDGSTKIQMDEQELSEAIWLHRDEVTVNHKTISLTAEMIETFRRNEHV